MKTMVPNALLCALLIPAPVALTFTMAVFTSADASAKPSGKGKAEGEALAAELSRKAAGIANPIAPTDEAALLEGMKIYRSNCSGCHGGMRGPSIWGSTGFVPPAPQFWQRALALTPQQAFVAIRDGIPYSGMASWRSLLTEPQMWQAANFVSRMHSLPPAVDAVWKAPPAPAPTPAG